MSRAFVKEPDGADAGEDLPERLLSPHPNYLTPGGLHALQLELAQLRAQLAALPVDANEDIQAHGERLRIERDLRYYELMLQKAVVIESHRQPHADVRFGAAVTVVDPDDQRHTFTIVGESETCAPKGYISWVSPLASALLGRRLGDTVIWERPAGNVELEIVAIAYPDLSA